jgi:hypothetical protein
MKSAIPFGQRYFDLYLIHYESALAFSSILYPPKDFVFVTSDLLGIIDLSLDLVGLTLLCCLVFFSLLGVAYTAKRFYCSHD